MAYGSATRVPFASCRCPAQPPPPRLPRRRPRLPLRRPPEGPRLHQREVSDRADPRPPRTAHHRPSDGASPPGSALRVAAVAGRRPRVAAIAALTDPLALSLEFLLRGGSVGPPREILRRLRRRGARRRQRKERDLSDYRLTYPCSPAAPSVAESKSPERRATSAEPGVGSDRPG